MIFPQSPQPARRKRPNDGWTNPSMAGHSAGGRWPSSCLPVIQTRQVARAVIFIHLPQPFLIHYSTFKHSPRQLSYTPIHSHTTPLPTNSLSQHRQYGQSRCGVPQLSSPTHCCNHTSLTRTSRSRRRCRWWYWSGKIIPLVLPYPRLPH